MGKHNYVKKTGTNKTFSAKGVQNTMPKVSEKSKEESKIKKRLKKILEDRKNFSVLNQDTVVESTFDTIKKSKNKSNVEAKSNGHQVPKTESANLGTQEKKQKKKKSSLLGSFENQKNEHLETSPQHDSSSEKIKTKQKKNKGKSQENSSDHPAPKEDDVPEKKLKKKKNKSNQQRLGNLGDRQKFTLQVNQDSNSKLDSKKKEAKKEIISIGHQVSKKDIGSGGGSEKKQKTKKKSKSTLQVNQDSSVAPSSEKAKKEKAKKNKSDVEAKCSSELNSSVDQDTNSKLYGTNFEKVKKNKKAKKKELKEKVNLIGHQASEVDVESPERKQKTKKKSKSTLDVNQDEPSLEKAKKGKVKKNKANVETNCNGHKAPKQEDTNGGLKEKKKNKTPKNKSSLNSANGVEAETVNSGKRKHPQKVEMVPFKKSKVLDNGNESYSDEEDSVYDEFSLEEGSEEDYDDYEQSYDSYDDESSDYAAGYTHGGSSDDYDSYSGEDEYGSEEEDWSDGDYDESYDFMNESDDTDYEPPGEEDNLYVPNGAAVKYDLKDDHNLSFDSNTSGLQIIELPPDDDKSKQVSIKDKNPSPAKSEKPKQEEQKNEEDSDDSCPELIPIDYENSGYFYDTDSDSSGTYNSYYEEEGEEEGSYCESEDGDEEMLEEEYEAVGDYDDLTDNFSKKKEFKVKENFETRNKFYNSVNSRQVIVLLKDPIYLYGTLVGKSIAGNVEIFGYTPTVDESFEIFSPRGYSAVSIQPKKSSGVTKSELKERLNRYQNEFISLELQEILDLYSAEADAVVVLERNDQNKKVRMLRKYMKENLFPNINSLTSDRPFYASEYILRCQISVHTPNALKPDPKWQTIRVAAESKFLVIGGKSVGKSTLVRYLVNANLREHPRILLIDLDIGQPEVFVPQTISATLIESPLLGPGYFFDKQPEKSLLFGDLNPLLSPVDYVNNVKELLRSCYEDEKYQNIPWIVNTMGYNKGFGSELIAVIASELKPTEIIQLQSPRDVNNFDFIMDRDVVQNIPAILFPEERDSSNKPNHRLALFDSVVDLKSADLTAKDKRLVSLISHLGGIQTGRAEWLTDVTPLSVPIDDIDLVGFSDDHLSKDDLLEVINGNLVYLCEKNKDNLLICHGIGLVRAVDTNQKKIYLVPNVHPERMRKVDVLATCNIPLPSAILLNQGPKIKSTTPYISNTVDFSSTKFINQIFHRPQHFLRGKPPRTAFE